jgi:gliding motility-associated-like protein
MREYLECQLSSVLLLNHKYCVELKLSLGDKSPFAVSNIGVYFSADSVNSGFTAELNFTPQVLNPTGAYLSDTSNWMTVSGAFVATGSEKFIVIGNFEPSISTDTISVPVNSGASPFAYYYVDDVSIKECSTESVPNTFTPNNDGQNDFVDFSGYTLVEQIVTIYDRWGLKVFESSESNTKWDGKDLKGNDCTDGVYYYLFHYADFINTDYNSLDRKGFIQLIR